MASMSGAPTTVWGGGGGGGGVLLGPANLRGTDVGVGGGVRGENLDQSGR